MARDSCLPMGYWFESSPEEPNVFKYVRLNALCCCTSMVRRWWEPPVKTRSKLVDALVGGGGFLLWLVWSAMLLHRLALR